MAEKTKIVRPKNKLKEKVGDGGFDEKNLEKAQKAIEENEIDFAPIAMDLLAKLQADVQKTLKSENMTEYHAIQDTLMQLRAQGSMFRFPSITAVTDIIVDLLDKHKKVDKTIIEIIIAYQSAAQVIIKTSVKSEKDPVCRALSKELVIVCQKYAERKAKA